MVRVIEPAVAFLFSVCHKFSLDVPVVQKAGADGHVFDGSVVCDLLNHSRVAWTVFEFVSRS